MPSVNVTINGKTYRMACDEGQEQHLLSLADELNGHVDSLKGTFGEIGDGRLTVMAALLVTDQMHELRRRVRALEGEVAAARVSGNAAAERFLGTQDTIVETLTVAAERIERLAAALAPRGS